MAIHNVQGFGETLPIRPPELGVVAARTGHLAVPGETGVVEQKLAEVLGIGIVGPGIGGIQGDLRKRPVLTQLEALLFAEVLVLADVSGVVHGRPRTTGQKAQKSKTHSQHTA